MAVTPLQETHDVYSQAKQVFKVEMLRDPAVPPDYAMNLGFEVLIQRLKSLNDNIFGVAKAGVNIASYSSDANNITLTFGAGYVYFLGMAIPITGFTTASLDGTQDYRLYLQIKVKRWKSDDVANGTEYGAIDPSTDLTFTAVTVLDTHNEWRFDYSLQQTVDGATLTDDTSNPLELTYNLLLARYTFPVGAYSSVREPQYESGVNSLHNGQTVTQLLAEDGSAAFTSRENMFAYRNLEAWVSNNQQIRPDQSIQLPDDGNGVTIVNGGTETGGEYILNYLPTLQDGSKVHIYYNPAVGYTNPLKIENDAGTLAGHLPFKINTASGYVEIQKGTVITCLFLDGYIHIINNSAFAFDDLTNIVRYLEPVGVRKSFIPLSGNIGDYFGVDGLGIGNFVGWAMADGRNGTPDMSGRFSVNYDATDSDFDMEDAFGDKQVTPQGSVGNYNGSIVVTRTGWGTSGGSLGSVTAGQIVVGSGSSEVTETLQSLRSSANNQTIAISHGHSFTGDPTDNLPPYFTELYIIKIQALLPGESW